MPTSTRVRGRVLAFAFALAVVTYLDRICISAAAPFIMNDLHLTGQDFLAAFPSVRRIERERAQKEREEQAKR